VLLVLHLFGLFMAQRKHRESPIILRAATIALSLGVLQLLVAGAMIGMHLPPVLRSLHEATGVSIWIATFALAYLARVSGDGHGVREPRVAIEPKEPKEPWQTSADLSRAVGESDNRTSSLPLAAARRSLSTMSHSVAVIVARGADV
jgi:hypothetical protein